MGFKKLKREKGLKSTVISERDDDYDDEIYPKKQTPVGQPM